MIPVYIEDPLTGEKLNLLVARIEVSAGEPINDCIKMCLAFVRNIKLIGVVFNFNGKDIEVFPWDSLESVKERELDLEGE